MGKAELPQVAFWLHLCFGIQLECQSGFAIRSCPMTTKQLRGIAAGLSLIANTLMGASVATDNAEVIVYGGTSGGVIAAVQAAKLGKRVVLIEPGRHLGGLTSGGLGATDYGKKDSIGGLSREFYQRVKQHYANPAVWKYERPGDYVSHGFDAKEDTMWAFEPRVAEKIYSDLVRESGVQVVYGERLELKNGVQRHGQRLESIAMEFSR